MTWIRRITATIMLGLAVSTALGRHQRLTGTWCERPTGPTQLPRRSRRVTNAQDQDITADGWTITAGSQHTWYPASVPWPTGSLRGFDVTADGQTLVTIPARERWRRPGRGT